MTQTWLVTGAAGFIGSHLVETLLKSGHTVIGIDNFLTGSRANLVEFATFEGNQFHFIEGDIRREADVKRAFQVRPVDYVLHQAALGSVSRSMEDPISTHDHNVAGFLNVLWAAKKARVKKFVYASSSSVYGDHPALPKVEGQEGLPLSPYAQSKSDNEKYAALFHRAYGVPTIGLRYFNVFGPRQSFNGPYAAVIPNWVRGMLKGETISIFGDGETSRDFCFIENVVQANLKAALTQNTEAFGRVFNIAVGDRTTLLELFDILKTLIAEKHPRVGNLQPVHKDFRAGDIRHSLADISLAKNYLEYDPKIRVCEGLKASVDWYCQNLS